MTLYAFRDKDGLTISDLLTVEFTAGKQFALDTVAASTGTARFRRTDGNYVLLDALMPDQYCEIRYYNGSSYQIMCAGYIEDVTIEWGNPSTGGVYNADYVTVTWSGALAQWGRTNANLTVPAGPVTDQLQQIYIDTGLSATENFSSYSDSVLLSYSLNGAANDYLQFLTTTTNCRYDDYSTGALNILSAYNFPSSTYNFTDSTPSSTLMTYQASNWDGLSVNYYNQVLLSLGDFAIPVVATDPAATEPYRVLQLQTLWPDSGSALGYAQFLLDLYDTPAVELSSVTCLSEAQNNQRLPEIANTCIGKKFSIVHRGTTVYGICEGFSMTASPGSSQFTFYFSNPDQDVAWFILDSSTQGVLNVNKLGF